MATHQNTKQAGVRFPNFHSFFGGSFRSAFTTALVPQYLCSRCASSNRISCCVLWSCHGHWQALRLVSFYAADWSIRPPAESTLVPAMSAQRTLSRLPVGGHFREPGQPPLRVLEASSIRVLPSESFHPSPSIRVLPSEETLC